MKLGTVMLDLQVKIMDKICPFCGKEFKTASNSQKCCSRKCSRGWLKFRRDIEKEAEEQKKKRKTVKEIVAEARKHGMSYGKYVAMMQKG